MEFYTWFQVPQVILSAFGYGYSSLEELVNIQLTMLYVMIGVGAGLYLIGLIMGGIGLQTMAKRAGLKYGWIGYLPFGNTFLSGKLAGETRVFGQKMKRIGLYTMLVEIAYVALTVILIVSVALMARPEYFAPVTNPETDEILGYELSAALLPESLWTLRMVTEILVGVFDLVLIFFFCMLYFAFFRKYYARSPFLMTFLCAILPARGFVLFAVRNNTPVDYAAYVQQRMRNYHTQQSQPPYGGYGGPYGGSGSGPYGGSPYGNSPNGETRPYRPEEPFPDYGSPADPSSGGGNTSPDGNGGNSGVGNSDSPFDDF